MPGEIQHRSSSGWLFFQMRTFYDFHGLVLKIFGTQQQPARYARGVNNFKKCEKKLEPKITQKQYLLIGEQV